MLLQVQAVLQAQREELLLAQFAVEAAGDLVAELRHPLAHQRLVVFVVLVHRKALIDRVSPPMTGRVGGEETGDRLRPCFWRQDGPVFTGTHYRPRTDSETAADSAEKTHQMADGGEFVPPATGCHGAHICTARGRPATRGNAGPLLSGGI